MAVIGSVGEFQPEAESFAAYVERVEMFFAANAIPNERKAAVFLSLVGAKTFSLVRNLVAPQKPSGKSVKQLIEVLMAHFEPKPVVITERFRFNQRNQGSGESVTEYVAELKRLAVNCEFGDRLEDALRDRLVCGIRNSHIQRRLLSESELTYARAVELAVGMEAAETNAQQLQSPEPIRWMSPHPRGKPPVTHGKSASKKPSPVTSNRCHRCDRGGHSGSTCKFKTAVCYYCHKPGHLARACHKKKAAQTGDPRSPSTSRMHQVVEPQPSEEATAEPQRLFRLDGSGQRPITVQVQVNGVMVPMEVDTGAARTIMSLAQQQRLFPSVKLKESHVVLRTYVHH